MSNIKYIKLAALPLIALLLFSGGCKKYLDQKPITESGPDQVFKDVPSAFQALIGVYSRLVGDQGYGIRLSLYYTVDNDEMQGPSGNSDADRRDIARYLATPSNAQLERPFNQIFQGIEYANICIDNIPKMDMYTNGTEQQKKQLQRMLGEALTLRAQFYLEAIRNWGDLPAHFQPAYASAGTDPFPKQTDRDTLYNRLIEDLRVASDLVPWRSEVPSLGEPLDERITKGTVKGLRARIALYRGGYSLRKDGTIKRGDNHLAFYQIARDEAEDIINSGEHNLNPSFRGLWKDQVCAHAVTDPDGELMFQASGIGLSGAEDTKLGYYNGPRVNNKGNSSINVLATYFYSFDSTDLRRDVTCAPYFVAADGVTKIGQQIANMNDGKYRRDWITNPSFSPDDAVQYFGLKWQILRYSDVLLMFAEADNELNGPTPAAYNAVNMVRRRGFGKPINTVDPTVDLPAGLGQTDFFNAVVRERSFELGGEGVRKFDLLRWNLLATKIAETKANLLLISTRSAPYNNLPQYMYYNPASTADHNNIGGLWVTSLYKPSPASAPTGATRVNWARAEVNTTSNARLASGFISGKSELLPFPQAAIDANFNLEQNPQY